MNGERTVHHVALLTTYGGAVTSVTLWGLRLGDLSVIMSALIAMVGVSVTVWITLKRNAREKELHELRMKLLRDHAWPNNDD